MLAEVGPKTDLAKLVAEVAVAADQQSDRARRPRQAGDRPGGGAPGLAMVDAEKARARRGAEMSDSKREHRLAVARRLSTASEIFGWSAATTPPRRSAPQPQQSFGNARGREVVEVLDDGRPAGERCVRAGQILAERPVEGFGAPLQQEPERALLEALPRRRFCTSGAGMIADGARRVQHLAGGASR